MSKQHEQPSPHESRVVRIQQNRAALMARGMSYDQAHPRACEIVRAEDLAEAGVEELPWEMAQHLMEAVPEFKAEVEQRHSLSPGETIPSVAMAVLVDWMTKARAEMNPTTVEGDEDATTMSYAGVDLRGVDGPNIFARVIKHIAESPEAPPGFDQRIDLARSLITVARNRQRAALVAAHRRGGLR